MELKPGDRVRVIAPQAGHFFGHKLTVLSVDVDSVHLEIEHNDNITLPTDWLQKVR